MRVRNPTDNITKLTIFQRPYFCQFFVWRIPFPIQKNRADVELENKGTGKKSVSFKTTDNRVSRPHRRITDANRCTQPNKIAVFFTADADLAGDKQRMQIRVDTAIRLVPLPWD